MLAQKNLNIGKAVGVLMELSADERTRLLYEEHEKARLDELARMNGARAEGSDERAYIIARNMLKRNKPIDEIAEDTGLTYEEVKRLM